MSATLLNTNARLQRKSLNDQIDRLDSILDGLAEALNESVADAVKQAVTQVVKATVETSIREVLSNPALLECALAGVKPAEQTPGKQPTKPGWKLRTVFQGLFLTLTHLSSQTLTSARRGLTYAWKWSLQGCRRHIATLLQMTTRAIQTLFVLGHVIKENRVRLGLALTTGAITALVGYHAGLLFAAGMCGLSSALLSFLGRPDRSGLHLIFKRSSK